MMALYKIKIMLRLTNNQPKFPPSQEATPHATIPNENKGSLKAQH
jgi:hypothetical protein